MDELSYSGNVLVDDGGFTEIKLPKPVLGDGVKENRRRLFRDLVAELDGKRNVSFYIDLGDKHYIGTIETRLECGDIIAKIPSSALTLLKMKHEVLDGYGRFYGYEGEYGAENVILHFCYSSNFSFEYDGLTITHQITLELRLWSEDYVIVPSVRPSSIHLGNVTDMAKLANVDKSVVVEAIIDGVSNTHKPTLCELGKPDVLGLSDVQALERMSVVVPERVAACISGVSIIANNVVGNVKPVGPMADAFIDLLTLDEVSIEPRLILGGNGKLTIPAWDIVKSN